jgi:hypothetical protein
MVVVLIDVEPIRERFSAVALFFDERAVVWTRRWRRLLQVMVACTSGSEGGTEPIGPPYPYHVQQTLAPSPWTSAFVGVTITG